jgi:hypothetical protein
VPFHFFVSPDFSSSFCLLDYFSLQIKACLCCCYTVCLLFIPLTTFEHVDEFSYTFASADSHSRIYEFPNIDNMNANFCCVCGTSGLLSDVL